ncbi:hypothetical protein [Thermosporothrix hazakensis]|uniref:Uncharacterized protein n=1 Tax=Thermosporothrix sp. COM3 TaxID=2490863 RepID=A0A455SL93_9CHLR|nr:hypothetical protein [Thermosporothrix hazakensis]BBH87275.1 hypothetical protein KTC_20260 [Thermosporothrix sp. COM3]BBH87294.1 hypothetical protein KTC_20450 [Thermosporothrix sp. COM3]BBH88138.1 hypothetical protein KTC_28890 [Thermosporothrix sp. COM3]BBH88157.1 hypothetical protein KTC_29080 [Thermosporothrix sp. COM3]GCE46350.1 hypothetical protein KTH_12190 [Thermosporothrix hazakensis]
MLANPGAHELTGISGALSQISGQARWPGEDGKDEGTKWKQWTFLQQQYVWGVLRGGRGSGKIIEGGKGNGKEEGGLRFHKSGKWEGWQETREGKREKGGNEPGKRGEGCGFAKAERG